MTTTLRWIVCVVLVVGCIAGCEEKRKPRAEPTGGSGSNGAASGQSEAPGNAPRKLTEIGRDADGEAVYAATDQDRREYEATVPGTWVATMGKKERGEFYSTMTLELRKDKTLSLKNEMPEPGNTGKTIVNQATGQWDVHHVGVIVNLLSSADGRPIPEDQKRMFLEMGTEGPTGKIESFLTASLKNGPTFRRKPN